MATYADMQNWIADEIQDSSLTNQIKISIQRAIQLYERKRFYFNTKIGTFNMVGGQEFYGAAANADIPNLIQIFWPMKLSLNGFKYDINPTDNGYIESSQNGQIIALPMFYAYYAQQLRFFPIPDQNYPVTMDYQYRLPTLVNDSDTNAWMNDGEMLIREAAKRVLGVNFTKEIDPNAPPNTFEQSALDALQAETRARFSNGQLAVEYRGSLGRGRFNIFTGYS
jgi:hypothetical protein